MNVLRTIRSTHLYSFITSGIYSPLRGSLVLQTIESHSEKNVGSTSKSYWTSQLILIYKWSASLINNKILICTILTNHNIERCRRLVQDVYLLSRRVTYTQYLLYIVFCWIIILWRDIHVCYLFDIKYIVYISYIL